MIRGTPASLLDVNTLVALAWPHHVAHVAARDWFLEHADAGWATTPVTEMGFVRISSNRRAMPVSSSPATAVSMLRQLASRGRHQFWVDDVPWVFGETGPAQTLRGHQQVTDLHLVELARRRGGRLVTFDQGIQGEHVHHLTVG